MVDGSAEGWTKGMAGARKWRRTKRRTRDWAGKRQEGRAEGEQCQVIVEDKAGAMAGQSRQREREGRRLGNRWQGKDMVEGMRGERKDRGKE